jgi:hypothetical protein
VKVRTRSGTANARPLMQNAVKTTTDMQPA